MRCGQGCKSNVSLDSLLIVSPQRRILPPNGSRGGRSQSSKCNECRYNVGRMGILTNDQLMLIARQNKITIASAAVGLANMWSTGVYNKLWVCPTCYASRRVELLTGLSTFVVLWDMLWTLHWSYKLSFKFRFRIDSKERCQKTASMKLSMNFIVQIRRSVFMTQSGHLLEINTLLQKIAWWIKSSHW